MSIATGQLLPTTFLQFHHIVVNKKSRSWIIVFISMTFFISIFLLGNLMSPAGLETDFLHRKIAPNISYPFGTDWLGRDMLVRTVKGLCSSLKLGLLAASLSSIISLTLGLMAATLGPKVDYLVSGLIDLVMSTPHLVLLILISFACGGGVQGVVIAVAVSHWPRLARIIRAEILVLRESDFILLSQKFGKNTFWITGRHMVPHVLPQFIIGLILMFPHAILHSAGLTFLGFGIAPHDPSIGVLLSESMRHISTGYWWLAILPGLALIFTVKIFDTLGNCLRYICDPTK
ncbi:MAG: ABC transporter permease [Desulfotalea sp.]